MLKPRHFSAFRKISTHFEFDATHSAHITKAWLCSERVWVLNWPVCSPDLFGASLNKIYYKGDPKLLKS